MNKRSTLILVIAVLALSGLMGGCGPTDTIDGDSEIIGTEGDRTQEIEITDDAKEGENQMKLQIGEYTLTATLADNSSAQALKDMLEEGPLTIDMRDYANMEKVGPLGKSLPRNDEQITTEAGDIILYQGNALVIYYAPNSWNFTRIGKIDDVTQEELKKVLGNGDVKVILLLD